MTGDMKASVYYTNSDVRLETRPIPTIGPGDILVQTRACGLCGGETMEWYQVSRAPKVLGHEPTGVIVEVGDEVTDFSVGDRVFAHHHVPCMSCRYCTRGLFTLCPQFGKTGLVPGGFAEYFCVPEPNLRYDTLKLPDSVSFEAGTLIEPMACALKGLRMLDLHPGGSVAVIGTGFIGMCYVTLLSMWGAGRIFALDFNAWRRERAKEHGATDTIDPGACDPIEALREANGGFLADAVISTAPTRRAWELGIALCERGGTFQAAAPGDPEDTLELQVNDLYFREIRMNATYSATHIDTRAILDYLAVGRVDASTLITHRFGLDRVGDAIRLLMDAGESLKSVIVPYATGNGG